MDDFLWWTCSLFNISHMSCIFQIMYENMQLERNILKEAEIRLMEENKSLINQQKGQSSLLTNLQTIQVWNLYNFICQISIGIFLSRL